MKTLKQLREEYDSKYVPQADVLPEELVLEDSKYLPKMKTSRGTIPSPSQMPAMLLFKRISYRMYPNSQVVALYYSKMVDKYLSIPFGPTGNLNLSESRIMEEGDLDHACWKGYKAKGLKKKGKRMVPNCVPVSERKGDNDYPETTERGITESFRAKVTALREAEDKKGDFIRGAAETLIPYASAYRKFLQKDYKGAATDAAIDTGLMAVGGPLVKGGVKLGLKGLGALSRLGRGATKAATGAAEKAAGTGAKAAGAEGAKVTGSAAKAPETPKAPEVKPATKAPEAKPAAKTPEAKPADKTPAAKPVEKAPKAPKEPSSKGNKPFDLGTLGTALAGAAAGALGQTTSSTSDGRLLRSKPEVKTRSTWQSQHQDPVQSARLKNIYAKDSGTVRENKITDLRKMIKEGQDNMSLNINGREVTLNTNMAKRILEVYDSVNTKNKKIVESMLNEDLESFKKLLNFSIRN